MVSGFVQEIWRFPVLGMAGEPLRSTRIDARGIAGDRRHFAAGPEGQLTAQDLPRLADWTATFPFNPDGALQPENEPPFPLLRLAGSGRTWRWGDPRLAFALERSLGRPVELVRDLEAARGVTIATVEPAVAHATAGINLHLSLRLPQPGWSGRELIFEGGVRLKLVASRADGPGIEARVVESGRILIGESVTLG